jgi:glycine/D-amino acid oxidase-like deaminating enzyme
MILRSGTSVWELLHDPPGDYPQLTRDADCDVVVVGGGISGAMIAVFLARAGMRVIVLDRDRPIAGSTMACTGLVQYELDVPLIEMRKQIGVENAERAYQTCYAALQAFPTFAASIGADAHLVARPSLYLAGTALGGEAMRAEVRERASLGISATYLDESALFAAFGLHRVGGAILSDLAFEVDPVGLTAAFLRHAAASGVQIFGRTTVAGHESTAAGVRVATAHGPSIRARHIVYATGYEADQILGFEVGTRSTTYAMVTEQLPLGEHWPRSALIWEASTPYFYARATPDGRICLGGADEPCTTAASAAPRLAEKADALIRTFATLRPGLTVKTATAWAGTFITSHDGLPYIGSVDRFPNATFALAYGGNGILFSFLAGQLVRDRLGGTESPFADLVAFARVR